MPLITLYQLLRHDAIKCHNDRLYSIRLILTNISMYAYNILEILLDLISREVLNRWLTW